MRRCALDGLADRPAALALDFIVELRVTISATLEIGPSGPGGRQVVPITGGDFEGPKMRGRILPGGADWQTADSKGLTAVDARYVIQTDQGIRIEVRNRELRHASPSVVDRHRSELPVDPANAILTSPQFTVSKNAFEWLMRSVFIGVAERYPDLVVLKM